MKNLKFLSVIVILITGLIFYACSNDSIDNEVTNDALNKKEQIVDTSIPVDMEGIKFGSIILPKGTISEISQDGSRLDFKLPKNFVYVATDSSGRTFFADAGSYTCTSTCSGGCDVVRLGDVVGCSACPEGSTASCTGKRGEKSFEISSSYSHLIGDGKNGGLINLEDGINFINHTSKRKVSNNNIPSFDILTKHPQIESEFNEFFDNVWNNRLPNEKNSKEVLVNVYGQTISLLIPIETYQSSRELFVDGDDISCGCSSGSTGCTIKAIKKGFIVVGQSCIAGACTSCTMSW